MKEMEKGRRKKKSSSDLDYNTLEISADGIIMKHKVRPC